MMGSMREKQEHNNPYGLLYGKIRNIEDSECKLDSFTTLFCRLSMKLCIFTNVLTKLFPRHIIIRKSVMLIL